MLMKMSAPGVELTKFFESCKLKAYPDPGTGAAPWTIGWGHTGHDVYQGLSITQARADFLLTAVDLPAAEALANKYAHATLNQGQFDALVDTLFNVGPGVTGHRDGIIFLKSGQQSTLLRKLNSGDYAGCAAEFAKWTLANGQPMRGLIRRRAAVRAMFEGRDWRAAISNL